MYFSLILGQAPITANLENDYRCKDIKLESRLMLKNIVGLLTLVDTSSSSPSRSRGRPRCRRAGPRGPGSSRPSSGGSASGREGGR